MVVHEKLWFDDSWDDGADGGGSLEALGWDDGGDDGGS